MPSALSVVGLVTVLLAGAAGAYEWDRRPPIGWHAHILWWSPGFYLPPSLAQQRDDALAAGRQAFKDDQACLGALHTQSDQVTAAGRRSAAVLEASSQDLTATRQQVAGLRRQATAAAAYVPVGVDACARWEDADRMVLLMLRGG